MKVSIFSVKFEESETENPSFDDEAESKSKELIETFLNPDIL